MGATYSAGAVEPGPRDFDRAREGDQTALEKIWQFYAPYVRSVARTFYRPEYGEEFREELFAEARFRFCKAVQYFKADNPKGVPFNRYARTIIARALLDLRLSAQRDLDNLAKTDLLDLDELREVAYMPEDFERQNETLPRVLQSLPDKLREYALLLCTGKGWLASATALGMTREEAKEALAELRQAWESATDGSHVGPLLELVSNPLPDCRAAA